MQKAEVKKSAVDLYVSNGDKKGSPSPNKGKFPNPTSLAKKYGVEEDEALPIESASAGGKGSELERIFSQGVEFTERHNALLQKLDEKNQELERLCILLEAVEPIPGMDANKYKHILENPGNESVDFRDSKIVSLAKKCRKLQLALTKEKSQCESQVAKMHELCQANDRLQKELDALSGGAQSGSAISSGSAKQSMPRKFEQEASLDDPAATIAGLQKELSVAHKHIDELRRKLSSASDEVKALQRALARELGEGVSIEQAVDGGWRGRAQQIVLLKSKVKRLEAMLGTGGSVSSAGASTIASRTRTDVDSRAEEELAEMSSERKIAVEQLTEERARLFDECQRLEAKMNGQRARIRTLESEALLHKQQLKIVLDKSGTDDQLVQALRGEIERLKQQLGNERRSDVSTKLAVVSKSAASSSAAISGTEKSVQFELDRLRRLCKQQAEQLSTQDAVIRSLRKGDLPASSY